MTFTTFVDGNVLTGAQLNANFLQKYTDFETLYGKNATNGTLNAPLGTIIGWARELLPGTTRISDATTYGGAITGEAIGVSYSGAALIAAGFSSGEMFTIVFQTKCVRISGSAGDTAGVKCYINSSNSLSGATLLWSKTYNIKDGTTSFVTANFSMPIGWDNTKYLIFSYFGDNDGACRGYGQFTNIALVDGVGVSLPTGWALCDGGGGRPDLSVDYYLRGTSGTTGGSGGTNTHGSIHFDSPNRGGVSSSYTAAITTNDSQPPYYAVIWIIKVGT